MGRGKFIGILQNALANLEHVSGWLFRPLSPRAQHRACDPYSCKLAVKGMSHQQPASMNPFHWDVLQGRVCPGGFISSWLLAGCSSEEDFVLLKKRHERLLTYCRTCLVRGLLPICLCSRSEVSGSTSVQGLWYPKLCLMKRLRCTGQHSQASTRADPNPGLCISVCPGCQM